MPLPPPLKRPEKVRATFSDALKQTTRTPLYIRPLMWGPRHLECLHISTIHLATPKAHITDEKLRYLYTGSVNRHCLEVVWYWAQESMSMIDFYLPNVIISIIDSIQHKLKEKPFQIHTKCLPADPGPCLDFDFGNRANTIHPEILISTTTNIPILIYSGPHHKEELRYSLSFRVRPEFEKIIRDIDPAGFGMVDPFDVACMLAMAQEQQLRLLNLGERPDSFTVHLLTPTTSSIALHLFTARVPKHYIDALYRPSLLVSDDLIITRELIGLSPKDISEKGEGLLVDKLGGILEEAFVLHQAMTKAGVKKETEKCEARRVHEKQIREGWWISKDNR